jgi:hypothetical protein
VLVFSLIDCAALPMPHPALRYIEPGDHALGRSGIFLSVYYLFRLSMLFYSLCFVCVGEGWVARLAGELTDWLTGWLCIHVPDKTHR